MNRRNALRALMFGAPAAAIGMAVVPSIAAAPVTVEIDLTELRASLADHLEWVGRETRQLIDEARSVAAA